MNKKILICILFLFFCVAIMANGCLEKELTSQKQLAAYQDVYEGESENWKVRFVQNVTEFIPPGENVVLYDVDGEIILTYKGNPSELSSVQKMEYSYARNSGGGGGMDANPSEKIYGHRFSHGGATVDREEAFNVIVNLDGKKETIEVKRLNKL